MSTISSYPIQNAGGKTVYRSNTSEVKIKLEEIGRRDGRSQEAELSSRARRQAAEAILSNIDFYA